MDTAIMNGWTQHTFFESEREIELRSLKHSNGNWHCHKNGIIKFNIIIQFLSWCVLCVGYFSTYSGSFNSSSLFIHFTLSFFFVIPCAACDESFFHPLQESFVVLHVQRTDRHYVACDEKKISLNLVGFEKKKVSKIWVRLCKEPFRLCMCSIRREKWWNLNMLTCRKTNSCNRVISKIRLWKF